MNEQQLGEKASAEQKNIAARALAHISVTRMTMTWQDHQMEMTE